MKQCKSSIFNYLLPQAPICFVQLNNANGFNWMLAKLFKVVMLYKFSLITSTFNFPKMWLIIAHDHVITPGVCKPDSLSNSYTHYILCTIGRFENTKISNINLNQMGSNGTHKNKTYLSKETNSKVHIAIGKCIEKTGRESTQKDRI